MRTTGVIAGAAATAFTGLASAACNTFTPDTMSGGTLGYVKQNSDNVFRTSEAIECTSDLAESDGGETGTCAFYHYAMGLEMHPSLNVTASDANQIYELVRTTAGSEGQFADFNETIVMNYTVPFEGIEADTTGYYTFSPVFQCWAGTLEDCDDADSSIDGSTAEACGLLTDSNAMGGDIPPELRVYDGTQELKRTNDVEANSSEEPQPPYEENSGEATVATEEDPEDGAGVIGVNLSVVLAAGLGCMAWSVL